MKNYLNKYFEGERILYGLQNAHLQGITFGHGESPLKEAKNIDLKNVIFKWKYPLWYDAHVRVDDSTFETMSRSGIWYTTDITITNSSLQAPKLFRRAGKIKLDHVHFADAQETMWTCKDLRLTNSQINGDYFGKDSENAYLDHVSVVGNYLFDGGKNIEVQHCNLVSKDAFWNCENVVVYDSFLDGEYLAWNTKNITFINCTIESDQGLNYIDHLKIRNSNLIHTDLAFEYVKHADVEVNSKIDSVKNPLSGQITAPAIGRLILDPTKINPTQTKINCQHIGQRLSKSDQNQQPRG